MRGAPAILGLVLAACAARPGPRATIGPVAACPTEPAPIAGPASEPPDDLAGQRITTIGVSGAGQPLDAIVHDTIAARPGTPLDPAVLAEDVRRLYALGAIAQVEVRATRASGGVAVELHLTPRAPLARVDVRGDGPAWVRARLASLAGALDEPARTERLRRRMVAALIHDGYRDAAIATARTGDGLCVAIDAGRRFVIDRVIVTGNDALPPAMIEGVLGRDLGQINARGGVYRPDLLPGNLADVVRLYGDRGYLDVSYATPAAQYDDARGRVTVTLAITQGPLYRFGDVKLSGDVDDLAGYRALVGAAPGQRFARRDLAIALAGLEAIARARGARVDTSTNLDRERGLVELELVFHRRSAD